MRIVRLIREENTAAGDCGTGARVGARARARRAYIARWRAPTWIRLFSGSLNYFKLEIDIVSIAKTSRSPVASVDFLSETPRKVFFTIAGVLWSAMPANVSKLFSYSEPLTNERALEKLRIFLFCNHPAAEAQPSIIFLLRIERLRLDDRRHQRDVRESRLSVVFEATSERFLIRLKTKTHWSIRLCSVSKLNTSCFESTALNR
ncbi:hypothetical protein EVAR_51185_1 [Eumeta japonica]|uniref:Uncharacterized protein n=1 Tax=Eumeta variegata TaxID=151549 RepID=A0A4C1XDJ9_EUMVA|nr:hypothetical protein EVAR_51185_1 [Eumeta japonica]